MTFANEEAMYRTVSRDIGLACYMTIQGSYQDLSRVFQFRFLREIGCELARASHNAPGVIDTVKVWVATEAAFNEVNKSIETSAKRLRHDWFECPTQVDRQNMPALIEQLLAAHQRPAEALSGRLKGKISELFSPPEPIERESRRPPLRLVDD